MQRPIFLALLAGVAAIGACSLINAPEAVRSGGAGGSGGGGSSSSGALKCSDAADCKSLDDECGVGTCINGMCKKQADDTKEGKTCDDGLFCTDNDTCQAGTCKGAPKACPAAPDACHESTCDEMGKMCQLNAAKDGTMCDDGDPCTDNDSCVLGKCTSGGPTDCTKMNNECATYACVAGTGCTPTPINENGACDVNNVCAQSKCIAGTCTPTSFFNGKACDDGLFCTENDGCNMAKCIGTPKVCPGANACQLSACDEASKTCSLMVLNDGTACDDGNSCTFGTTCKGGACTPAGTVTSCVAGDSCCPASCTPATDSDCPYWAPGVLQNVNPATLVGWKQCYSDTYADAGTPVATILSQCNKGKLLMACRPVGAPTFALAAMGPRADVLFDCGTNATCTKQSNGVGWYFNDSYSWGFAPGGEPVNRSSCDYNNGMQTVPTLRMCWHTGNMAISSGYRCGSNTLNGDSTWQRVVFHAD